MQYKLDIEVEPASLGNLTARPFSDDGRYLGASCLFDDPAVVVFDLAEQKHLLVQAKHELRILQQHTYGRELAGLESTIQQAEAADPICQVTIVISPTPSPMAKTDSLPVAKI